MNQPDATKLAELLAIHDCQLLLARYAEAVNRRDNDAFASLFTEDAIWRRPGYPPIEGRQAIHAFMETQPYPRVIRHVNGHNVITIKAPDTASGVSMTTVYYLEGDHALPVPLERPHMVVEYHDRFSNTSEGWRFAERRTTVVFSDQVRS